MVVHQPQEMEPPSLVSSFNTHPDYVFSCTQATGVGVAIGGSIEPTSINSIDQLKRIESSLPGVTNISDYEELYYPDQNGRHDEFAVYP